MNNTENSELKKRENIFTKYTGVRKQRTDWSKDDELKLIEAHTALALNRHKWVDIKAFYNFEERTPAELRDKYRSLTKNTSHKYSSLKTFALANEVGKVDVEKTTFRARFPKVAAERFRIRYRFGENEIFYLVDINKNENVFSYIVGEDGKVRALEKYYNVND